MRIGRFAALLAAFALTAAGCGDRTAVTAPDEPDADALTGRTFWSVEIEQAGRPRELVADTKVSVWFTDDGRLVADAGCNSMQAPLDVDGDRLRVSDVESTGIGCDEARHRQDRWLAGFLADDPSWRLDGDRLVLSAGKTSVVLQDKRTLEKNLPLRGTTWKVRSFSDGEVASAMADAEKAWLRFEGDRVVGSTGCNDFGGRVEISERRIVFEPVVATLRACTDRAITRLEDSVLSVIDDATVTYRIEGDDLTLERDERSLGLVGTKEK